ncbi:hypothetical protein GQ600_5053 [Phytophthora cactorum]|nr:hypothetical protein GQ600_5053 [Phytophthora cactorum]
MNGAETGGGPGRLAINGLPATRSKTPRHPHLYSSVQGRVRSVHATAILLPMQSLDNGGLLAGNHPHHLVLDRRVCSQFGTHVVARLGEVLPRLKVQRHHLFRANITSQLSRLHAAHGDLNGSRRQWGDSLAEVHESHDNVILFRQFRRQLRNVHRVS